MEKLLGNNIPYNTTNNKDISNMEYSDFTQLLTDPNMLPAVLASINSKEQADVIATYVNNNFISISEIAKIIQKTTQATVSMIKTNEKTFPVPINIANTNLYNKKSTMNWLINHNKIRRDTDEMINEEFLYGVIKTAVLVGGPGCGKSTLSTGFAEETLVPILRKIFSAGGSADTENTIKIHLKKTTANYVVFHYFDDCQTVPIAITEDNIKRIIAELDKCKKSANLYREEKTQEGEAKLTRTYVELVLTPNQTIMEMMTKHNIDVLTIVDTPGIDSKHIGENISSADIMIVVLGDRQNMEWIANNIKENVIPCSATAKYLYLYNNRYYLGAEGLTEEECQNTHDEYFEDAKHDLKDYEEGLKELQDESVIGSTLSACKPLQSLLCVPVFDIKKRPNKNEIFFFKQLADKMSNTFENSLYAEELNAFKVDEAGEFFLEIMEVNINKDKILKRVSATTKYTINDFCNEKHGRTKSLDDYSIEESYTSVLSTLKQQVYEEFKKYKTVDCNDIEMSAIRLAFLTINEGLMNKVHFGKGTHPWEDIDSPTQMICEEILSQQITKGCIDKEKTISEYIEVMKKNGVSSGSWNFVELEDTDWNRAKILINVNYGFTNLPANNLEDMIKWCHFLPAILIQSVLSYYKLQNHEWKESDFSTMYDTVMKRIYK